MRNPTPMRGSRPLRTLGLAVVLVPVLGGVLAAAEPAPRNRHPGRPVLPRGPFSGVPALPSPIPMPFPILPQTPIPPVLSELGVGVPTDRCLVTPSPIDARSLKVAASIDPGIFAEPRVQGLPIGTPVWRPRR